MKSDRNGGVKMSLANGFGKIAILICLSAALIACGCINAGNDETKSDGRTLEIDFLYLDLSTCERCRTTDKVLDEALDEMREDLRGVKELTVRKIKVGDEGEAKKYEFVKSPTIRVNGKDIEEILSGKLEIKDNYCESCAQSCGTSTCRIFEYNGKTYEAVPKEMIKDAIAKVLGLNSTIEELGVKPAEVKPAEYAQGACCGQTTGCCGKNTATCGG
jgi:hypothetical protein